MGEGWTREVAVKMEKTDGCRKYLRGKPVGSRDAWDERETKG